MVGFRIVLALIIICGGLSYTLWHIWCVLPLSTLWRNIVVIVYAMVVLSIIFVMSPLLNRLPLTLSTIIYEIGGSGPMIMLYTLLSFLILDILHLLHIIPRSVLHSNGYTTIILFVLLTAVFVYGNIHYYQKARQSLDFTTTKPLDKDLKLVLVSDLHIGYHNRRATLEKWVELLNKEKPDMILMAGDLIDRSMRPLLEENMAEALRQLSAPVYAAMGNHEYYCGAEQAEAFYRDANITLLRDSVVTVNGVNIICRDDRTNSHRKDLAALVAKADTSLFTIMLDHQPWHLEEAEAAGIDFQFSGHTHDGQIIPMSLIIEAVYENGYGASARGKTQYYVTSGLGIWGGKFRIGTCSEYVVATIRSEEKH